jgi:hypothetical protein
MNIKDIIYEDFKEQSRNQLISVYKARVDLDKPCCEWGGIWAALPESITYRDVKELL